MYRVATYVARCASCLLSAVVRFGVRSGRAVRWTIHGTHCLPSSAHAEFKTFAGPDGRSHAHARKAIGLFSGFSTQPGLAALSPWRSYWRGRQAV
jgi:hypothetical protein